MKKIKEVIIATILGFSLSGCLNEEDVHTKDFYMENENARLEKVAFCKNRPDKQITDQNCINAIEANSLLKIKAFREDGLHVEYKTRTSLAGIKKRTTDFYMNNEKARIEKLKYCENHSEPLKFNIPNCLAAMTAESILADRKKTSEQAQ